MPRNDGCHQDFCVAVAAHPTGRIDVQGEAEMVKSCILYADRIRLYSPTASLVLRIGSAVKNMSHEEAVDLALDVMRHTESAVVDDQAAAGFRKAALEPTAMGWTKRAERQRLLKRKIETALAGMGETARKWSSTPAFMDLNLAAEHGILSFVRENTLANPMDQVADFVIAASGGRPRSGAYERDRVYKEGMLAELLRSVTGDFEYPLLDRGIQDLVREGQTLGIPNSPTLRNRSKAMGLGENIFSRLPVPQAPMDELLDLRQELSGVVSRFRRGLLNASAEMESAQWDESFYAEASHVYERHVAPALEELEELLKSSPALHGFFQLSSATVKSMGAVGGLYLIADKMLHVRPELSVALGLSAAVATLIYDQIDASRAPNKKARDNDWFLVYQARSKLESSDSSA